MQKWDLSSRRIWGVWNQAKRPRAAALIVPDPGDCFVAKAIVG